MEKKGKILVSILFLVILAIFTGTVSAADLNVNVGDGIQAGIDGASVNDTNSTTVTLMATALSDPGVQSVDADAADTTGPVVVSRDPANNTVNVPSNETITITFNENIHNGTGWIELLNSNGTVIPANLSVSGSVLTIVPINSLVEDRYSFCIHTGSVTDLAGNLVASSVSYFIVGVSPLISTTDPVDGATNVTLDKIITVTFNEPVKVGSGSIELCNSTNTSITVPITTSINGNVLTITHSGLLVNGTRYFLCLHTGCVTDLAGNPLAPILKSFTTSNDGTTPTITSRDPANNAVNVASNKTLTITFNENIRNETGWIELKNSNGTVIPTNLSVNGGVLTVIPVNSLAEDRYSFCIHTGSVADLAGNLVASSVSYFIVGVSPVISVIDPVDGATNVTLDKIITVTFNEPVKLGSGFIELCNLTNTSITIPITISINGNVLTITHSGLLAPGTHYGLCLHTGSVTDMAGNPLNPILKSLTTSNDGTAPIITSRDPANNQIDVPSFTIIRVTFNENIRNGTGWIELKNSNGTIIPTNVSISGKMLNVTPVNSLIVDNYTFLIHTGSVTDLAGNPIAASPSYFSVGNPPIVTVNHESGVYRTTQTIILNATDDFDSNPTIYYTTDGSTPTTSSTTYTSPITISTITILKFMAVDNAGNQATVATETYYFSIQDAINDASTNDTILVNNGTYTENIIINKQLTLEAVSDGEVMIQASDLSSPVITISSTGSGSTLQGFSITGNYYGNGIYIDNASNCTFTGNTISENLIGIYLNSASNNTFTENNITNNYNYDMYFANASNNTFNGNNLGDCILYHSPENTLRNNTMSEIEIEGSNIFEYTEDIDTSNTINGDPVYYLIGQSGLVFNGTNIGYLILINCDNITISNVNINSYGTLFILNTTNSIIQNVSRSSFYLYNSSNNTLSGIDTSQITLESSNHNTILESSIFGNRWNNNAIQLLNSSYNNITGNYLTISAPASVALSFSTDYSTNEHSNNALYLELSSHNLISENTISADTGIYLESSPDNTISENNMIYCYDYGIYLDLSPNNIITGNNMTDCYGYNINLNSSANNTISNNYILVVAISNSIGIALSNTSNCTITGNTITGDSSFNAMDTSESITNYGINLVSSTNNLIEYNTLTNNWLAIGLSADNNTFKYNNITGNFYGMLLYYSFNDTICGNNIIGNIYGINTQESIVTIEFNRIIDNTINGLIHQSDICHFTVTAINNWWGSNSAPSYSESEKGAANCDINNWGGTVTHDTWLVLTINSSSNILVHDTSCTLTAYLIYNNQGIDTSSSGTVLDGIPITFSSNLGTFTSPVSTEDGVATTTFNAGTEPGVATIYASLDDETNSKSITITGIYNTQTNKTFNTIQAAITDETTMNGDTIILGSGTYLENIVLTKQITLTPGTGATVTIQASNPSNPVITIESSASNSTITDITITGATNSTGIYLNGASNCTFYLNDLTGNYNGIYLLNTHNNTIYGNSLTNNTGKGVYLGYSDNNTIQSNNIASDYYGIYLDHSNNTSIIENNIADNTYGINSEYSSANLQLNRIAGNNNWGLYSLNSTINATNNWWGSNTNPTTTLHGIYSQGGSVNCTSWLVLGVNVSSTNSGGNTSITADLTHNNQGGDTSSQGHIPNGIPVNFTNTFGTVIPTAYTVKGKASTILNLNSLNNATVTATASLDNQTVNTTGIISTGVAVLNITSTAIDNSTGLPLNTTYNIPLNESVTWLSALWINTGMFTDELQIIVDGTVVQDKYFNNTAYTAWQNSYSTSVFNAIAYVNQHLSFVDSSELTNFWNNLTTTYNLTSDELTFIQNHSQEFIDNLTVNIVYSGVPGLNLTVTDPTDNNTINLNFPGTVIQRTSQVIYIGSPGEGVKSFAIATTDITDTVLQHWQNQYSSYQTGDAMNVAYNTFLTALQIEYLHDRIADNITTSLNVTWSRTSPVIVSVAEDPYQIYETLESDHTLGMTVIGTIENMWVFNFVTSCYISLIEYEVMGSVYNSTFSSVVMELIYLSYNYDTYVEAFEDNGFVIIKSTFNDFMVIDLETGIVRDIDTVNNCYGGVYECGGRTTDYGKLFSMNNSTTSLCCITWLGYRFYHWQVSDPWDLGDVSFEWNGLGKVYISSNDNSLADIAADNKLTITGPNGEKTVEGTQAALDITDILKRYTSLQTLHLVLKDTDGGFIGTSPLYIVQTTLKKQKGVLPQSFPIPDIQNILNNVNMTEIRHAIDVFVGTGNFGINPTTDNYTNDPNSTGYYDLRHYTNLDRLWLNHTLNTIIKYTYNN